MLLMLTAVALLACEPETPVRYCDSLIVEQTRSAIGCVRAVAAGMPKSGSVVYEGTVKIEGHLMRPGMTYQRPVRLEVSFDTGAGSIRVCESVGSGRSLSVETVVLRNGRVAKQERAGAPFRELIDERADEWAAATGWFPSLVAGEALKAAPSCRLGAGVSADGGLLTPVSFSDGNARACTLLLGDKDRPVRVERLVADDRLGDVCNWTSFADWQERDSGVVPARLSRFQVVKDATLRYELSLASFDGAPPAAGMFDVPAEHRGTVADWGVERQEGGAIVEVGKGLWEVDVESADSRVLVIERKDDLVVLEAPANDAVCRGILERLCVKFPSKPVGVVAVGHHHPASSGGVRAFAAAGATVVVPRAMESFIREALSRPVSLGGPVLAERDVKVDVFDGERMLGEGETAVRLVDIGERSRTRSAMWCSFSRVRACCLRGILGTFRPMVLGTLEYGSKGWRERWSEEGFNRRGLCRRGR
ncbi:MAG: hypothetical protein QM783_15585 [Phycisphaerales bacterium]